MDFRFLDLTFHMLKVSETFHVMKSNNERIFLKTSGSLQ